jgi:hypothetical protein
MKPTAKTIGAGRVRPGPWVTGGLFLLLVFSLPGCSYIVSSAANDMAANISRAVLDNNDLKTVATGLPAYLLMIDGMVEAHPEDDDLLQAAATLNGAYAGLFVKEGQRAQRLTDKALDYAFRAICVSRPQICRTRKERFRVFEPAVQQTGRKDVPKLYALGAAWAGWIQAHREDMNAIADLPRVEAIMQRVVELDAPYDGGAAHMYLGAMSIVVPPALGGNSQAAEKHFKQAIKLSEGKNLIVKVVYAEKYARILFDRKLHDRLLKEVLAANPNVPGYTLMNTYAQERARELLAGADEYF